MCSSPRAECLQDGTMTVVPVARLSVGWPARAPAGRRAQLHQHSRPLGPVVGLSSLRRLAGDVYHGFRSINIPSGSSASPLRPLHRASLRLRPSGWMGFFLFGLGLVSFSSGQSLRRQDSAPIPPYCSSSAAPACSVSYICISLGGIPPRLSGCRFPHAHFTFSIESTRYPAPHASVRAVYAFLSSRSCIGSSGSDLFYLVAGAMIPAIGSITKTFAMKIIAGSLQFDPHRSPSASTS